MRTGVVEAVVEVHRPAYRISFDDGRSVICTGQHPWLCRKAATQAVWRSIERPGQNNHDHKKRLNVGDQIRSVTIPWDKGTLEDGWFGGMLDGEGSISNGNRSGASISVSQKPGVVWDKLCRYAFRRGYHPTIENDLTPRLTKYGKSPVPKLCFNRMDEIFRLIGQTQPERFRTKRFWEGRELPGKRNKDNSAWATIVAIEPLGDRTMVDLQTSIGTYIAEGLVSHNTTITLAITLFWLALHPNTVGVLVADNDKNIEAFRETIKQYVASLTGFMGKSFSLDPSLGGKSNNAYFRFSNGSRLDLLVAGKTKKTWGESRAYKVGHLCMAPGTPVIIKDGWVKPIEDISVGDTVITHTGAAATVVDVLGQPNAKGKMMRITPWMGQPITCTKEHKFPTHRGLIPASEIRPRDYLLMPVREITGDGVSFRLPSPRDSRGNNQGPEGAAAGAIIGLTEEVGFAIGYYLAEGTIVRNSYDKRPCAITFSRHRTEIGYADRAIAAFAAFTTGHRKTVDRLDSLTTVETIYSTPLAVWIEATFGATDTKRIPDDVFAWGQGFCRGLLTGLLCGDGSKSETTSQGYRTETVVLPTTRSSIAMQARDIAAALGYGWAAARYESPGNHYGRMCKATWRMNWTGRGARALRQLMGLPVDLASGQPRIEKYKIAGGFVYLQLRKIEYGVDEPYMWDISVDHEDHTFRTPYGCTSNTELAKYGQASGLASFMESIAPENPESLYIMESTAFGENHWKDHWEDALSDTFTKRAIFVGWWSHDLQMIRQTDPRFTIYGTAPPNAAERDRMVIVAEKYGLVINREQLAWYRWRAAQKTHGAFDLDSNQPWLPEDAFVSSGISFFRHEIITKRIGEIREAPKASAEEGGYQYKGYRFILGNDFHVSQIEQILTQDRQHEITLRVWEEPKESAQYVIGCDPAFGRNDWKDKHAISIWRVFADKMVQVAEYAEFNCETRQAAWVLAYLAAAYADCRVNIDMQGGPGQVVKQEFNHLRERMTSELYAPIVKDKPLLEDFCAMASSYIYRKPDSPGKGYMFDTVTTQTIKFKMMNIIRDCHCTDLLEIRSIPLLDEMRGIRQDGPDIGAAAQGRDKDDRVFAAALATITWVENLRSGLIAQGRTWESSKRDDAGLITPIERQLNKRIYDILRGEDEIMNAPPPRTYLEDRGLY